MTKKPVKKPVKKPANEPAGKSVPGVIVRPSLLDVLAVARSRTDEASGMFGARLEALRTSPSILQDDLAAVTAFDGIGKAAEAPSKAFMTFAAADFARREGEARAAGDVEPKVRLDVQVGRSVLSWRDNRRASPAWKDHAAKLAQTLHAVWASYSQGDSATVEALLKPFSGQFDQQRWEEAIRKATPKTGSLTPTIVEG